MWAGPRPEKSSFRLQGGLQFRLGDDALARQIVGQGPDPAAIVAQAMVFGLGDRLDPAAELVHRHDLLGAQDLANLVHLAVEIGQSVRLDIHRLTHEFRGAAQVVVGAEGLIVHDRGLAHSGPHAKTFRSADASRHPIFVGP